MGYEEVGDYESARTNSLWLIGKWVLTKTEQARAGPMNYELNGLKKKDPLIEMKGSRLERFKRSFCPHRSHLHDLRPVRGAFPDRPETLLHFRARVVFVRCPVIPARQMGFAP